MMQQSIFFAAWIGTGLVGMAIGSLAVRRAARRSSVLYAQTQVPAATVVENELVSAA